MFKIGQKIVCIKAINTNKIRVGDVLKVDGFSKHNCAAKQYVHLSGFDEIEYGYCRDCGKKIVCRIAFYSGHFAPLQYSTNLNKEILENFQPTEEKADVEIKELC